jgi:hypothetical protein
MRGRALFRSGNLLVMHGDGEEFVIIDASRELAEVDATLEWDEFTPAGVFVNHTLGSSFQVHVLEYGRSSAADILKRLWRLRCSSSPNNQ